MADAERPAGGEPGARIPRPDPPSAARRTPDPSTAAGHEAGPGAASHHAPPGGRRPDAPPGGRPGARRPPSVAGLIVLATAAFVAAIVTFGIFLPALGVIGDTITHDPTTLPARLSTCGRDWQRDPLARELTAAEVFERTEAPPVVVSTGLLALCPAEATADGQLVTTVYVRTGGDAYVGYDLVGSP